MILASLSDQAIKEAIELISKTMKGQMPNLERALLHADRKDLRAELERRQSSAMPR
jgi:hypothetical protein